MTKDDLKTIGKVMIIIGVLLVLAATPIALRVASVVDVGGGLIRATDIPSSSATFQISGAILIVLGIAVYHHQEISKKLFG